MLRCKDQQNNHMLESAQLLLLWYSSRRSFLSKKQQAAPLLIMCNANNIAVPPLCYNGQLATPHAATALHARARNTDV